MYLHPKYAAVSLPVRQLRGFARVTLEPGETKTVALAVRPEDMMFLDRDMLWRVPSGVVDVMIGSAADHIVLSETLQVKADDGLTVTGLSTQPDLAR
jgi:beta-glucosidase